MTLRHWQSMQERFLLRQLRERASLEQCFFLWPSSTNSIFSTTTLKPFSNARQNFPAKIGPLAPELPHLYGGEGLSPGEERGNQVETVIRGTCVHMRVCACAHVCAGLTPMCNHQSMAITNGATKQQIHHTNPAEKLYQEEFFPDNRALHTAAAGRPS